MIIFQPSEILEKALIPVRKMITREGKTFMTTVYVGSTKEEKIKQATHTALMIAPTVRRNVSRSTVEFMKQAGDVIDYAPDDTLAVNKVLKFQSEYFKGKEEPSLYEIVQMASEEVSHALSQSGDSGKGWYKDNIREARRTLCSKFPNLAGDTEWDFFLSLLSILSPGVTPTQNMRIAVKVYDEYNSTGTLPLGNKETGKAYSYFSNANLGRFNEIFKKYPSKADFVQYINGVTTVGEVNANGGSIKAVKDSSAYNSMIFGEKVGMFYQSLRGTDGAVAVDRWAIRSYYRWAGRLRASFNVKEKRNELNDDVAPYDRQAVEYVMQTVGEKLGLSPSDTQAVMWYYEKRLYRKLGVPEKYFSTEDYATAARVVIFGKSLDYSSIAILKKTGRLPSFDKFVTAILAVKRRDK